ncbi:hypothetical protein RUND412_008910 [Rhizina undulata]
MTPPLHPSFPLPAVHNALSPYINPSSTTLYQRQLVSAHIANLASEKRVTSNSGSTDEFQRFLALELGRAARGRRRELLEALREYHSSKSEWEEAQQESENENDVKKKDSEAIDEDWKYEYLQTLKLRRQLQRITILREYLSAFTNGSLPAPPLQSASVGPPPEPPVELLQETQKGATAVPSRGKGPTAEGEAEMRIRKLEVAVLKLHSELSREEKLLAEVREDITSRGEIGPLSKASDRKKIALARAREELIAWIEEKLSKTSPDAPPISTLGIEKKKEHTQEEINSVLEITTDIKSAYDSYLSSRTTLVQLLASAKASSAAAKSLTLPSSSDAGIPAPPGVSPLLPAPNILKVLVLTEELIPMVHAQKALLQCKNHLSLTGTSSRKKLLEMLNAQMAVVSKGAEKSPLAPSPFDASVVSLTKALNRETAEKCDKLHAEIREHVQVAEASLDIIEKAVTDIDVLAVAKKRAESRIPLVRKGGRRKMEDGEEQEEASMWRKLAGDVGVIGDGI